MPEPSLQQVIDQSQSLEQRQELAPQQLQSLKILMATLPELEQKISSEMEQNPTLEMLESGTEQLAGNPVEQNDSGNTGDSSYEESSENALPQRDDTLKELLQLEDLWHDRTSTGGHSSQMQDEDAEERRQHYFDSLTSTPSLQEMLLEQLNEISDLNDRQRELCEEVIGSIDDSGYLRSHPADIATACDTDDVSEIEAAIKIIQTFDPPGIGAQDLRECMLLQLERQNMQKTLPYKVVDKHLEDVGRNKLNNITKSLNISMIDLEDALHKIKQLHPYPGSLITPTPHTNFVVPEVFIQKDQNGEWQVTNNNDRAPRLRISPYYLELLKEKDLSQEAKSYIREKINNSKMLLKALEQRESTLVRISRSILKYQKEFFENGSEHLKPLTMSEVAQDIEVHETTVSRAIANKYVMTPHGLFPFKYFFTTGYAGTDGEQISSHVIRNKIRDLIASEDRKKPYSDSKIAEMLKQEGFKVARRTVAKYREDIGILSSSMRREH